MGKFSKEIKIKIVKNINQQAIAKELGISSRGIP